MMTPAPTKAPPAKAPAKGRQKPHREARTQTESSPYSEIMFLQKTAGNRAVARLLSKLQADISPRAQSDPPATPVNPQEVMGLLGNGEKLPFDLEQTLTLLHGRDFSRVRVHHDPMANHVSRSLGAEALSVGEHIAFRRGAYSPSTKSGMGLLQHEAGHVASERSSGSSTSPLSVQLKVSVEDVAEEMVGREFIMRKAQGAAPNQIAKDARVTVIDWKGSGPNATVEYSGATGPIRLDVPKLALEPLGTPAKGVRRYNAGLSAQQAAVESAHGGVEQQAQSVTNWKGEEAKYKKNRKYWEDSLKRLDNELARKTAELQGKETALSNILVRTVMYNRFDPAIVKWVDHYNAQLHPSENLDPNMVKSIFFQESRVGTAGEHLEKPPYSWSDPVKNPIRSRFNIGQAIDSSAHQQFLMIKEMSPALYAKYKLGDLEKENKAKDKSEQEFWAWRSGDFSKAVQEFHRKDPATGQNAMGTPGKDLYEDYEFWIRTSVRWLFYKYFSLHNPSWPEAVRAYNGSGPAAQRYKTQVLGRVGSGSDLNASNQ